jgi:hypothetical protein
LRKSEEFGRGFFGSEYSYRSWATLGNRQFVSVRPVTARECFSEFADAGVPSMHLFIGAMSSREAADAEKSDAAAFTLGKTRLNLAVGRAYLTKYE